MFFYYVFKINFRIIFKTNQPLLNNKFLHSFLRAAFFLLLNNIMQALHLHIFDRLKQKAFNWYFGFCILNNLNDLEQFKLKHDSDAEESLFYSLRIFFSYVKRFLRLLCF